MLPPIPSHRRVLGLHWATPNAQASIQFLRASHLPTKTSLLLASSSLLEGSSSPSRQMLKLGPLKFWKHPYVLPAQRSSICPKGSFSFILNGQIGNQLWEWLRQHLQGQLELLMEFKLQCWRLKYLWLLEWLTDWGQVSNRPRCWQNSCSLERLLSMWTSDQLLCNFTTSETLLMSPNSLKQ